MVFRTSEELPSSDILLLLPLPLSSALGIDEHTLIVADGLRNKILVPYNIIIMIIMMMI